MHKKSKATGASGCWKQAKKEKHSNNKAHNKIAGEGLTLSQTLEKPDDHDGND